MIKAVIFDCFGVLVQANLSGFYDRHFGADDNIRQTARDLEQASSRGMITHEQWLTDLAALAGVSEEQTKRELDHNPPNDRLFRYIQAMLKPTYRIGFLSNTSSDWRNDLFSNDQLALFDDFVMSYQVQMAKPDERIYHLASERLGLLPEECVFVDDIERYCVGAEDAGMKSVHYKNFVQFEQDIRKLLD